MPTSQSTCSIPVVNEISSILAPELDKISTTLVLSVTSSSLALNETSSTSTLDEQLELAEIEAEIAGFHVILAKSIPARPHAVIETFAGLPILLEAPPVGDTGTPSDEKRDWHVTGTEAFEALFTEELTDTEFKQRLSDIRRGLVLPAEPVLSADIREFALLSVANCPTSLELTLSRRIVLQAELDAFKENHTSELNISDVEFRESIQIKPGFVLPEGSEIPLTARAYALKLLLIEPEMKVAEMIRTTNREIAYDAIHNRWRTERMAIL